MVQLNEKQIALLKKYIDTPLDVLRCVVAEDFVAPGTVVTRWSRGELIVQILHEIERYEL